MVVICNITSSGKYTEQTRKTLEFGSYAKGVKTRAEVKRVLDDQSLIIKRLRTVDSARSTPGFSPVKLQEVQEKWNEIESSVLMGSQFCALQATKSMESKDTETTGSQSENGSSSTGGRVEDKAEVNYGRDSPSATEVENIATGDCEGSVAQSLAEQILEMEEQWSVIKSASDARSVASEMGSNVSAGHRKLSNGCVPTVIQISDDEASVCGANEDAPENKMDDGMFSLDSSHHKSSDSKDSFLHYDGFSSADKEINSLSSVDPFPSAGYDKENNSIYSGASRVREEERMLALDLNTGLCITIGEVDTIPAVEVISDLLSEVSGLLSDDEDSASEHGEQQIPPSPRSDLLSNDEGSASEHSEQKSRNASKDSDEKDDVSNIDDTCALGGDDTIYLSYSEDSAPVDESSEVAGFVESTLEDNTKDNALQEKGEFVQQLLDVSPVSAEDDQDNNEKLVMVEASLKQLALENKTLTNATKELRDRDKAHDNDAPDYKAEHDAMTVRNGDLVEENERLQVEIFAERLKKIREGEKARCDENNAKTEQDVLTARNRGLVDDNERLQKEILAVKAEKDVLAARNRGLVHDNERLQKEILSASKTQRGVVDDNVRLQKEILAVSEKLVERSADISQLPRKIMELDALLQERELASSPDEKTFMNPVKEEEIEMAMPPRKIMELDALLQERELASSSRDEVTFMNPVKEEEIEMAMTREEEGSSISLTSEEESFETDEMDDLGKDEDEEEEESIVYQSQDKNHNEILQCDSSTDESSVYGSDKENAVVDDNLIALGDNENHILKKIDEDRVLSQRKDAVIQDEENMLKQWENLSFAFRDKRTIYSKES